MDLFGGIKNFATQIGNVGRSAEDFGRQQVQQTFQSGQQMVGQALHAAPGVFNAGFDFGVNMLQSAPATIVNLAEAGIGKAANSLSNTVAGKYIKNHKDGLIDEALLGPTGLLLGPDKSERVFELVGEKVADPMSKLYHNQAFEFAGSILNQSAGLFSTLSVLPPPVGDIFSAANLATESWYGAFLATGTFDGSVSAADALAPAKQAAEGLAQMGVQKSFDRVTGKLNKTSGKDDGHKEIGVIQSFKQIKSVGIKKYVSNGAHAVLNNYLGQLKGLGLHFERIAHRHDVVKGVLDILRLSNEVYDKYDKLSKTNIGQSLVNYGEDKIHKFAEKSKVGLARVKNKSVSAEHWAQDKAHVAGNWLGGRAHDAGNFLLTHRVQIGDTLHKTSSIFGGASAGLGIVAAGLALTGIGAPVAAVLGTVSLSLAAASAAAQAWYAVTKSVGTIDGSVSTGEANHAAAQAATNLALTLVSVEVSSAQAVAKAKTMLETKNALSFLHSNPRAVLQLDKATKFLNKLPGVNLGLIFRDAALVKRLKIGSLALKVAQIPAKIAGMGGLHGMLHTWHAIENKALALGHQGKALALTALHAGRQAFQKIGHGGLHLLHSAGRGLTNTGHTVLGKITDLRSQAAHLTAKAQMWARQGVHRGEAALLTGLAAALQGSHALTATANGFLQRSGGQMLHGSAHAFTESLSHNLSTARTVLGFLEGGGHPEQIGSALHEITQNLHGVTHSVAGLFSTVFGEKRHSAGPVHLPLRPVMPSFAGSPLSLMGHLPSLAFAGMPGHHTGAAPFSPLSPLFNSHSASHPPLGGSLSGFIGRTASAVSGTAHHMPSLLPSLMPGHGILPKQTAGFARSAVHMAQSLFSSGSHGHPPTAAPVLSAIQHFLPSLKFPVPSAILPAFAAHPLAGLKTAEHRVEQAGHQALSHMPGIPGALGHMMHGFGRFLQRKGSGDHPDVNPVALRDDLRKQSTGFVPDSNVRAKLGGHLGFDPGGARLHTGPAAASASRALNAEAFTIGNDVFFGDGRFDPHSPKGLGLIAHELTHVGQQTGTTGSKARFFTQEGGDSMEREAQQTAEHVLANVGSRKGLFVEDYVREYEGEGSLSQDDQKRLDRISVLALEETQRLLKNQGVRGRVNADALDVQIEIDLGEMSDGEAAQVWGEAILSSMTAASNAGVQLSGEKIQRAKSHHQAPAHPHATSVAPATHPPAISPAAPTVPMREFILNGKTQLVTEAQYQQLVVEANRRLMIRLNLVESGAADYKKIQEDFLNETHKGLSGLFGKTSDWLGHVKPPDAAIWDRPKPSVAAGREAIQRQKLTEAASQLTNANMKLAQAQGQWHEYINGTISGADTGIQVATVVRDTSFSIAIGSAAVVAAPLVAGGLAAAGAGTAVTAVGTTVAVTAGGGAMGAVLRGGSEIGGEALANHGHVNWHDVGVNAWDGAKHGSVDAATSVIGMGVGRLGAKFIRPGVAKLGARVLRGAATGAVSGGVGGFLSAVVTPPERKKEDGPETWRKWAKRVGISTLLGAGGGGLGGAGTELLSGATPGVLRRMFAAGASNAVSGGATAATQEAMDAHREGRRFNRNAVYKAALTSGVSSALPAGASGAYHTRGPDGIRRMVTMDQHNQHFDDAFQVAGAGRQVMKQPLALSAGTKKAPLMLSPAKEQLMLPPAKEQLLLTAGLEQPLHSSVPAEGPPLKQNEAHNASNYEKLKADLARQEVESVSGHGHERHGSQTTLEQQARRVNEGTDPTGKSAPTGQATKFGSNMAEHDAIYRARLRTEQLVKEGKVSISPIKNKKGNLVIDKNGNPKKPTVKLVVTGHPNGYGSGYKGPTMKINGQIICTEGPLQFKKEIPNALVILQYDPVTASWEPLTQYPTDDPVTY